MDIIRQIRDLNRSIAEYETRFIERYGLCLNETMVLHAINEAKQALSSGEIADALGLTYSNASKVIASVERKGYIERQLGANDRRQMYFKLSGAGHGKLRAVNYGSIPLPDVLKAALDNVCR